MDTRQLEQARYTKIGDIRPGVHCFFVYGKILKATNSEITRISGDKVRICEGVIADDSGCATFHFEGTSAEQISIGAVVSIRNGRSEVVDEHIRLEVDKFGKIAKEDASNVKSVNEKTDISAVAYERQEPRKRSGRF
jgi:ssDNA-binding replication factor A large subunit